MYEYITETDLKKGRVTLHDVESTNSKKTLQQAGTCFMWNLSAGSHSRLSPKSTLSGNSHPPSPCLPQCLELLQLHGFPSFSCYLSPCSTLNIHKMPVRAVKSINTMEYNFIMLIYRDVDVDLNV